MTYLGFLILFLMLPMVLLALAARHDRRRQRRLPNEFHTWPPIWIFLLHSLIALIYTTPWDNYLVAKGVWWYDHELVLGITFGWVPLEEYLFFVLQPILTGLWLLWLARRLPVPSRSVQSGRAIRFWSVAMTGAIWTSSVAILIGGWLPGRYISLELSWALPPIMLQLGFGADILWRHRRLVFTTIATATLYLASADALAIWSGTWTIDPRQSLGLMVGPLPLEEALFFLLTNTLVVFGCTLALAQESLARLPSYLQSTVNFSSKRQLRLVADENPNVARRTQAKTTTGG